MHKPGKAAADQIAGIKKQLDFANSEVKRLQEVVADREHQINEMGAGSLDSDDLIKRHRAEIDQWRKKLKDKDLERDEWVEERNQFLTQIQDLKTQLAAAKASDQGMTAEMINEVHFYQTEIDNWKNKCKGYENVFEELSKINEMLAAKDKENEGKLKENEQIISSMKIVISQLEEKERSSNDVAKANSQLEARLRELARELEDAEGKNKDLEKQTSGFDQELVDGRLKLEKLNREKNKLKDDLEEALMKIELADKKTLMKEEEIKRLNERLQTIKNE